MMTIDAALTFLQQAKQELGGDACLILSLTRNELQDTDIDGMTVIHDKDNRYVQVDCLHNDLVNIEEWKDWNLCNVKCRLCGEQNVASRIVERNGKTYCDYHCHSCGYDWYN